MKPNTLPSKLNMQQTRKTMKMNVIITLSFFDCDAKVVGLWENA